MIRKIFSLSFIFFVWWSSTFAQTSYVSVSSLNLRSSPTTESKVILQLKQGEALSIISIQGDWSKVEYNGTTGYVFSKYLETDAPEQPAISKSQGSSTVLICNSSSAYAYHRYQCSGLSRCTHSVSKVTEPEAVNKGYRACKICYR